jgi:hypothetical protein
VGHTDLPQPLNGHGWILDPWLEQVQLHHMPSGK